MRKSEVIIPIRGTRDRWPRDEAGDPKFQSYDDLHALFSDEQIIAMCNRYLRQQEYQSQASAEYEERKKVARKKLPPSSS